MRLPFGFHLTRTKTAVAPMTAQNTAALSSRGGWWPLVREPFTGAWQRNMEASQQDVLTNSTVFACIKRVAEDISKLWVKIVEKDADGIATELARDSPFLRVLRSPNHYQTRVKFFEYWVISKLATGNAYILKERESIRGMVNGLYVLDPRLVQVLQATDGSVYYSLGQDYLSGIDAGSVVPASEIIHDVGVQLFHPLCGVSPLYACALAATQSLNIQNNSSRLFANGSNLSGILTAPHTISNEVAERIQQNWEATYAGPDNAGKVAVLGDGLTFEPMVMTAVDAQLSEQVKWSAEMICSCFSVPPYLIGIGSPPPNTNPQVLTLMYYQQALQAPIENMEELLTKGLEMLPGMSAEFDMDALLRMDSLTLMSVASEGVKGGFWSPDEARAKFDFKPTDGGNTPYMQQQNWPLRMLQQRQLPTEQAPVPPKLPAPNTPPDEPAAKHIDIELTSDEIGAWFRKELMAA